MTTPVATEERINRLEGAFQAFSVMVNNMVTREEMQAHIATIMEAIVGVRSEMRASDESLRAEMRASDESLRAEMRASDESLRAEMRASDESLRAEMRAEIRAAFAEEKAERRESEIRNTRWIVGAIFAAATLSVAAIKLIP